MKTLLLRRVRPFGPAVVTAAVSLLAIGLGSAGAGPAADVKADKAERSSRTITDRAKMTRDAAGKALASPTPTPSAVPVSKAKLKKQLQTAKAEAIRKGDLKQAKKIEEQLNQL